MSSYIKVNENEFLGKAELNQLIRFLRDDECRDTFLKNTLTFGLIKNERIDSNFDNFKVKVGSVTGTLKIDFGYAFDSIGNLISQKLIDQITIPDYFWYWVKIKSRYTPFEPGTVNIDINGNLSGSGTEFLKVLRGQPNFPVRIKLFLQDETSAINSLEYDVSDVISNTNVVLSGSSFVNENNLKYAVIGTFTPGYVVPTNDKYIYQYNDCEITLVQESVLNTPPSLISGEEFFIARVSKTLITDLVVIQDKRNDIWQTKADFSIENIIRDINPLVGVEDIKYSNTATSQEKNFVKLSWGFRSSNYTLDSTLRRITISAGQGGSYKSVADVVSGDFNGWRLYFVGNNLVNEFAFEGDYVKILETVVVGDILSGFQINLTVDNIDPSKLSDITDSAQTHIVLVPDVENVEFLFVPVSTARTNNRFHFSYGVNKLYVTPQVEVYNRNPVESCYDIYYRYVNNKSYSAYRLMGNGSYFRESSFQENGDLILSPAQSLHPYTNGRVCLISSPTGYNKKVLNDIVGLARNQITNSFRFKEFVVGVSKQHQLFYDTDVISDDYVISLSTLNAIEGNKFYIDIEGFFNLKLANKTLMIRQDALIGTPTTSGTLLVSYTWDEFFEGLYGANSTKYYLVCVFDGTDWVITRLQKDSGIGNVPVGGIIMWRRSLNELPPNWQLCDGSNGTIDMSDKFVIGSSTTHPVTTTGGSFTIVANNLPNHSHAFGLPEFYIQSDNNGTSPSPIPGTPGSIYDTLVPGTDSDDLLNTGTGTMGLLWRQGVHMRPTENDPVDFPNGDYKQPYVSLYYVERIY